MVHAYAWKNRPIRRAPGIVRDCARSIIVDAPETLSRADCARLVSAGGIIR